MGMLSNTIPLPLSYHYLTNELHVIHGESSYKAIHASYHLRYSILSYPKSVLSELKFVRNRKLYILV